MCKDSLITNTFYFFKAWKMLNKHTKQWYLGMSHNHKPLIFPAQRAPVASSTQRWRLSKLYGLANTRIWGHLSLQPHMSHVDECFIWTIETENY